MGEQTARDRVWKYALTVAIKKGKRANPSQIAEMAGVSERMTRTALVNISNTGFLKRNTNPGGKVYYTCPDWLEINQERLEDSLTE